MPVSDLSPEQRAAVMSALASGNKLLAVTLVRRDSGLGLRQAVDYIEHLELTLPSGLQPTPAALEHAVVVLTFAAQEDQAGLAALPDLAWPEAEWLVAIQTAQRMLDQAYHLCEQCRAGQFSYETILDQLRADCPGFSTTAYEMARANAMLATR